jgi:D-alanine-D-alanine ligase
MSKVNVSSELQAALDKAFREDDQVLVEEFIKGREFTIGVFKSDGKVVMLPFTEVITENEFFDYQAKYEGKSHEVTPAVCSEEMALQIRDTAKRVYEVFNCRGIVRMDFIYEANANAPYLLEINTVPGQSEASIVPQQVRANGWKLMDFYTKLVEEAIKDRKL